MTLSTAIGEPMVYELKEHHIMYRYVIVKNVKLNQKRQAYPKKGVFAGPCRKFRSFHSLLEVQWRARKFQTYDTWDYAYRRAPPFS